jgi:hypothetical protein
MKGRELQHNSRFNFFLVDKLIIQRELFIKEPKQVLSNKEIEEVFSRRILDCSEGCFENQATVDRRIYPFSHRYVGV